MKRIFSAFFCLVCAPCFSDSSTLSEKEHPQIGRYQIVYGNEKDKLYILDTTNGQVWRSEGRYMPYGKDNHWELHIAENPTNHPTIEERVE